MAAPKAKSENVEMPTIKAIFAGKLNPVCVTSPKETRLGNKDWSATMSFTKKGVCASFSVAVFVLEWLSRLPPDDP